MSFLNRIEIIVGHGELALYKKILYVLHYFQKSSVTKVLKWASVEANMLNCCFKQYVMSSFSAVISVTRVPKPFLNLCFNVIIRKCWFSCSSVPGLVDSFCNKYNNYIVERRYLGHFGHTFLARVLLSLMTYHICKWRFSFFSIDS